MGLENKPAAPTWHLGRLQPKEWLGEGQRSKRTEHSTPVALGHGSAQLWEESLSTIRKMRRPEWGHRDSLFFILSHHLWQWCNNLCINPSQNKKAVRYEFLTADTPFEGSFSHTVSEFCDRKRDYLNYKKHPDSKRQSLHKNHSLVQENIDIFSPAPATKSN